MSDDSEDISLADSSSSDGEQSILSDASSSGPPPAKKQRASPKKAAAASKPAPKASSAPQTAKAKPTAAKPQPAASKSPAVDSSVAVADQSGPTASGDITRGPPVTTDIAAKKLISQYLRQQNRPYSAIQIHDNLHKRIQKGTIERVLTSMCLPGSGFVCKEYGKAKIYFVDQNTLPSDYSADQLEALQDQNEELKRQAEQAAGEERGLKAELQQLLAEPTDDELAKLLQEAAARVAEKQQRVDRLSNRSAGGAAPSSSASGGAGAGGNLKFKSLADAVSAHNQFRKAWHMRKMLCMEAVDLLSEGMGKKVKDVMAEMCLESDQDAGVQLPALLPELAP